MGRFVDGYSSAGRRWAVRSVCCEEGPTDGVEGQGEDGEDEGDESPARAEGRDDHGGPATGGIMKRCSLAPSAFELWTLNVASLISRVHLFKAAADFGGPKCNTTILCCTEVLYRTLF